MTVRKYVEDGVESFEAEIDGESANSGEPRNDPANPATKSSFSIQADSNSDTHDKSIVEPSGDSGVSGNCGVDSGDAHLAAEPDEILPDGREVYTL